MKLVRFAVGDSKPDFGVVIGDRAAAFADLLRRRGAAQPSLADPKAYLAGLLGSEEAARASLTAAKHTSTNWMTPRSRLCAPFVIGSPASSSPRGGFWRG